MRCRGCRYCTSSSGSVPTGTSGAGADAFSTSKEGMSDCGSSRSASNSLRLPGLVEAASPVSMSIALSGSASRSRRRNTAFPRSIRRAWRREEISLRPRPSECTRACAAWISGFQRPRRGRFPPGRRISRWEMMKRKLLARRMRMAFWSLSGNTPTMRSMVFEASMVCSVE